ncbi:MAG TPA: AAA family ATPase [Candidatus Paceibacterota bacterium]|nr:AAA family ATPase [Candidatus Paceibacterota bacterium]
MQVCKINAIKGYKSFADFEWAKFCKYRLVDKKNNVDELKEQVFAKFDVIFGENGSGKSSTCDILKSVSQNQDFQITPPTLAELEICDGANNQTYKYENNSWSGQVDKNSFLFFDVDFINDNIHTHGIRSSNLQQGAHTQKAGKLIIDLDKKANELKIATQGKKDELEKLQNAFANILAKPFNEKDKEFFQTYKNADNQAKLQKIIGTQAELKKLEEDLATLQKLNTKYAEINRLSTVGQVVFPNALPTREVVTELFYRQIKEKAQDQADEAIKIHFAKHKRFIESAKSEIPENYTHENCPLCMQPLTNATRVIEYYRAAFDQTYETEKKKFLTDIEMSENELQTIKMNIISLPTKVTAIFDALEKVKTDFAVQDIYKLDEKTEQMGKFSSVSTKDIDDLIIALESLKKIEREQVNGEKLYDAVTLVVQEVEKSIKGVSDLITEKNKLISDFKGKYSDQSKITSEIQEKTQKKMELDRLTDFLRNDVVGQIKNQNEVLEKQKELSEALKKAQEDLRSYLATTIPKNVITRMIEILGKFNLSFTLEHVPGNTQTKEYSFSFKIKDQKDNERDMKKNLSEGERQLISLAFFFAVNENLQNKNTKVLVFDDPITSLDSPNLKILAELIYQKTQEFSQVLVFTHHPLFFKYLTKCGNAAKFGVLKNAEQFGGSFMYFDPGFDLVAEVRQCNQEISQNSQNGTLRPEEIALKYGQLLRLAVERFIKQDLLMWDKEREFEDITRNLKQGKNKMAKLTDEDLETIANIYKYCNYSNLLHADKESPSAFSELTKHIDKFVEILNKV